ncbi:MAG: sigma-54-dependent Fis family transcriptional regulator [Sandaracinaceae bacterium]|nr:sigma-54-dependent Fis family transcriptional regulator [Sandaracinaceae bacterium]
MFPTPSGPCVFGRGPARPDDPSPRVGWLRQRPGRNEPTPPSEGASLSRRQLELEAAGDRLLVRRVGRAPLRFDGRLTDEGELRPDDVLEIEEQLVLLCVRRPVSLPASRAWSASADFAFGAPDRFGIVGESPAAWALRDDLAFAAQRPLHVLLLGPSGTGKELAAQALHALSGRERPMVARNAATIPPGIADAELFGNVRDYPNPGMKEREGLLGAADGSTLFLDEIGELPEDLQAHLLRVLDAGEHHRLGEERARRVDVRLVGATNRGLDSLKHDLAARMTLRIEVPPLSARREDVPLIARAILRRAASADPRLAAQLFDERADGLEPRLAPEIVVALARHPLPLGVRELEALLWRSIRESTGRWIVLARDAAAAAPRARATGPEAIDAAAIRAALDAAGGVVSDAAEALGLANRHVLHRLMKKHGVAR